MAKKLALFLKDRIAWKSLFKILLAVAAPAWLGLKELNWLTGIFFIFAFSAVYFLEPPFRRRIFKTSFWLLALSGLAVFGFISLNQIVFWCLLILFSAVFWLLDSLINFSFKNHLFFYSLLNNLILLAGAALFFRFFLKFPFLVSLVWFVFLILVLNEFCRVWDIFRPKKTLTVNTVVALAGLEIGVLTAFLPLGFINAAAFLTLFVIFSREAVLVHFKGELNLGYLFRQFTVFILAAILIFLACLPAGR